MIGIFAVLVLLGACGKLPKPFRRSEAPPDSLTRARVGIGVRVPLPEGTTEPMAKLIAASVVKSLTAWEIPAVVGTGGKLRYILYGAVVPPTAGSGRAAPRMRWRLVDAGADGESVQVARGAPGGEPFFTFDSEVEATASDWEWGSPKMIGDIGREAGRLLADAIAPADRTLIAATPVARGIWVEPITGAPGDGDVSLTRAMRFALMGAKFAVTSDPAAARHFLKGQVTVGAVDNKAQPVEIRWTVTFPDGGVAGRAVQRNVVPAGTFDGRWGESASIIAAAALDGIKNVLARAEETERVRISNSELRTRPALPANGGKIELPPPDLSPEPDVPAGPGGS